MKLKTQKSEYLQELLPLLYKSLQHDLHPQLFKFKFFDNNILSISQASSKMNYISALVFLDFGNRSFFLDLEYLYFHLYQNRLVPINNTTFAVKQMYLYLSKLYPFLIYLQIYTLI